MTASIYRDLYRIGSVAAVKAVLFRATLCVAPRWAAQLDFASQST